MKYNVVVATHHKTGTVWMDGVFKAIASDLGARYVDFKAQYGQLKEALRAPFILFNNDSDFRAYSHILGRDDVRILHLIRDPRDVLISAMHYHRKSTESWLHEPVPGYNNITYQRRLKALRTKFHQYEFEMDHSTAGTVQGMLKWRYGRSNCFEARYEDLRQDEQLAYWSKITTFLGFEEAEQETCSRRFWENSLFGGLSRLGNKHVRSGDVAQWKREFTIKLAYAFLARFPGALQSLAYETDHRWVVELQRAGTSELTSVLRRLAGNRWEPFKDLSKGLSGA
jgi:Sulfotransferase domain